MADKKISQLSAATLAQLNDLFTLVQSGDNKSITVQNLKKSFEAYGLGSTVSFPAEAGLQSLDAGKLVMLNANNKVEVAQANISEPGQYGEWVIEVTDGLTPPTPTQFYITFTGLPQEGDTIRIGPFVFKFTAFLSSPNDILIESNIADQRDTVVSTLVGSNYEDNIITTVAKPATTDTVLITVNPEWNPQITKGWADEGMFIPPIQTPTIFDVVSAQITYGAEIPGEDTFIHDNVNINSSFLEGYVYLGFSDIVRPGVVPSVGRTQLFGASIPTTANDLAENIEYALNDLGANLTVTRVANILTITATDYPQSSGDSDLLINDWFLSYMSIQTKQYGIAPNPDYVGFPIIGQLLFVEGGNAYVKTDGLMQLKLASTSSPVLVDLQTNNLVINSLISNLCVPTNDGELLSIIDYITTATVDTKTLLRIFNNLYAAVTPGSGGDTIYASKLPPNSLFIAFTLQGG